MLKSLACMIVIMSVCGCVAENEAESEKPGTKKIIAHRIHEKITIDGKLKETAWQKASVIDDFYTRESGRIGGSGEVVPAASRTSVRVLWDDENLYIGAELVDKDIYALKTEKNSRTWEDDVFEVFIRPLTDMTHYYEFHVTPKNITLELFLPRSYMGTWERFIFDGGMRSGVTVRGKINDWRAEDEGWTVEIAIPFSAFRETVAPPEKGTEWTVAFCRYDYSYYLPEHYQRGTETSSTAVNGFHDIHSYNRLIFR